MKTSNPSRTKPKDTTEGVICLYSFVVFIGIVICISICCVWVLWIVTIVYWTQSTCEKTFCIQLPESPICNTSCPGGYFVGQIELNGDCKAFSMHYKYVCPILGESYRPRVDSIHIKNMDDSIVIPEDRSMTIPFDWDGKQLSTKGHSQKKTISTFPETLKELRENPQNHRMIVYTPTCPTGAYHSVILQTCD